MFRPLIGWAIVRLNLECQRKLIYFYASNVLLCVVMGLGGAWDSYLGVGTYLGTSLANKHTQQKVTSTEIK
jgi:hypothetical protein